MFVAAISRTSAFSVLLEPDALERPLSQKTQQLHLDGRVNLPDLVQEQRPALRLLETTDPSLISTSERPLFVPEQFALQQRRRQRRAMHRHHCRLRARAELVNHLGDHFLARAALALQQHRRPGRRHLLHELQDFLHRRRLAGEILQAELRVELLLRDTFSTSRFCRRSARAIRSSSSSICKRPFAI